MALEIILLVPGLGRGGGQLRAVLSSFSLGRAAYSGGQQIMVKEFNLMAAMDDSTHLFVIKASDAAHIPYIRIEMNESTKTSLRNVVLYEFTGTNCNGFSIQGPGGTPDLYASFSYESLKITYNK